MPVCGRVAVWNLCEQRLGVERHHRSGDQPLSGDRHMFFLTNEVFFAGLEENRGPTCVHVCISLVKTWAKTGRVAFLQEVHRGQITALCSSSKMSHQCSLGTKTIRAHVLPFVASAQPDKENYPQHVRWTRLESAAWQPQIRLTCRDRKMRRVFRALSMPQSSR